MHKKIEDIKKAESSPKILKNIFSKKEIDAFLNSISEHNFLNIMFFQCEYIEIKDHLMFFSLILCFSIILQGNP